MGRFFSKKRIKDLIDGMKSFKKNKKIKGVTIP
jgi:hypothetical protein